MGPLGAPWAPWRAGGRANFGFGGSLPQCVEDRIACDFEATATGLRGCKGQYAGCTSVADKVAEEEMLDRMGGWWAYTRARLESSSGRVAVEQRERYLLLERVEVV